MQPKETWTRRPRRLRGVDYTACGEYFVTAVVYERACLLGSVVDDRMRLSEAGIVVHAAWEALPDRFPFVRLDDFVVMPNHVHGILRFVPRDELDPEDSPLCPEGVHLDTVVGVFKSTSAVAVNRVLARRGVPLWQRGYHEHCIRTDRALERIRAYIGGNPAEWPRDRLHPARRPPPLPSPRR